MQSITAPGGWNDSDDALHDLGTEGYYEWWYLDAIFESGHKCTLTYGWRFTVGEYHVPVVMVDVYLPDGTKLSGEEPRDAGECAASSEKCDVRMGEDWLRQEGDTYLLSMHTKQAGAELTFRRRVPSWKWTPEGLIVDEPDGKQGWVNAVPRGDVEGTLFWGDQSVKVKGQGYHDHNWGDVDFSASRSGWGWGRLYDERFSYVYGWLIPIGGGEAKPTIYLAMDDKVIFASDDLECTLSDYRKNPKSGDDVPNVVEMKGKQEEVEVECRLAGREFLEVRIDDNPLTGKSSHYHRILNDFTGTIRVGDELYTVSTDDAISEYELLVDI
jgi:predicted secreted hydrolase